MQRPGGYSALQIALHWAVAVLVVWQFWLGDAMAAAFRSLMRDGLRETNWMVWGHVTGGIVICLLAMWRLALRRERGVPPVPQDIPPALRLAARISHWTLYALITLLPVTGILAWFSSLGPAGGLHAALTTLLLLVAVLHVLAALWHQFVRKDGTLMRMLRPGA